MDNNIKSILITGGAGFIGSNFLNYFVPKRKDYFFINLDKLTYAGNLENLANLENQENYSFYKGDIINSELVNYLMAKHDINMIINFAAESHVDRSILGSEEFIRTNVLGTNVLLEAAKKYRIEKYLQVSTDEVYGSLGSTGLFTELSPLEPSSPYSASKASADLIAGSYFRTHKLPVCITRCSNNYGHYQFPEKLIPLMIINALNDRKLPVYGDGMNVRDWIHVDDHSRAIMTVLENGVPGETYNIGSSNEQNNLFIVKTILNLLGKSENLIEYVKDRPGHDRRYAIDPAKTHKELGWKAEVEFEKGLADTVKWYLSNRGWWGRILNNEYLLYYNQQYGNRN